MRKSRFGSTSKSFGPVRVLMDIDLDIPPGLVTFLPFVLIIAVFYLMLVRPNQKKQKKWQEMLSQLKNGDKVTTNGGIRGVVISVKDDVVQLRIAPDNVKLEFAKNAIASVTTDD